MTNEEISQALGFTIITPYPPHAPYLVKNNLLLRNQHGVIDIILRDPVKECDKYPQAEHFRIMCRPQTIEQLETIINCI